MKKEWKVNQILAKAMKKNFSRRTASVSKIFINRILSEKLSFGGASMISMGKLK
jgi:hypothetical protein